MIGFGLRQLECRKATHDMEGGLHFQTFLVFKCHVPDLWFETTDFKNGAELWKTFNNSLLSEHLAVKLDKGERLTERCHIQQL